MEKRTIEVKFRVTPSEREALNRKIAESNIKQLGVYLRRMALEGEIVQFDISGINALVSQMRYAGNNLNQLTKKAHETGSIAIGGIEALQRQFDDIWKGLNQLIRTYANLM